MSVKLNISFLMILMTALLAATEMRAANVFNGLDFSIEGQGRSSGVIAAIRINNNSEDEFRNKLGPLLIYVDDVYSPIWIEAFNMVLAPGKSKEIEVSGFSIINHMPVLSSGQTFEKDLRIYSVADLDFVTKEGDLNLSERPSEQNIGKDYYITYPGTDVRFPYLVDPIAQPEVFASLLLEIESWLQVAYDRMHREGAINTALKANPVEEQNFMLQLVTWMYSGMVSGTDYNQSQLYQDLLVKFNKAFKKANKGSEARMLGEIQRESERFFDNALKIGQEAGIFVDTRKNDSGSVVDALQRGGWCNLPGLKTPVFVEDPLTCEILNTGSGLLDSDAVLTTSLTGAPIIELNTIDHELKPGRIFSFSGVLNGDLNSRKFALKIANSEERSINILPDPTSGAFDYNWKVVNNGAVRVKLVSSDATGNNEEIFVSEFQVHETEITAGIGEEFMVNNKPVRVEWVERDRISLRSGSISYPMAFGDQISIFGNIFELYQIDIGAKKASLRVLWKDCCNTEQSPDSAPTSPLMVFRAGTDLISKGYKGVVLPPDFGYKTDTRTVGILAPEPSSKSSLCCGWQKFNGLDMQWETFLAIRMKQILEYKLDSVSDETGSIRVVLIDPVTRQLMANLNLLNETRSDEDKIWPLKKLINPDFVVDNSVLLSCCESVEDAGCSRVPVNVQMESMMINADNGLILTTVTSDKDQYDDSRKKSFALCYDPLSGTRNDFREYIIEQYCQKAANELIDKLSRRI